MARQLNRHAVTILAIKLVQPGKLADVTEGVKRLLPDVPNYAKLKDGVRDEVRLLIEAKLAQLAEGQRYVLTSEGESFVDSTGIGYLIEARRMFLLKETRKATRSLRSSTRTRSLLQ